MNALLPPWPHLSVFLLASLALALTPGPGVLYIVSRSLALGRRAGLASVAGVALGNLANALAAGVGLAALFSVSALAFALMKYGGALYLVYLGVQALRAPARSQATQPVTSRRAFRDGCVVALLNPKTTLFFAAFLPQFVIGDPLLQGITLGALFVAIAALTDSGYALAAGTIAPLLGRSPGLPGRWLSACTLIGLGLFTALAGTRGGK